MSTTIKIQDATFAGKILHEIALKFAAESATVRDIIEQRVLHEVAAYNTKQPAYFQGLVDPTDSEKTLNGVKVRNRKVIDGEQQVYVALDAFQRNGYFVLIDDVQAESLDQTVLLTNDTTVSFVKLTPLVGG